MWEAPPGAAGTILAEVECETDAELDAIATPAWTLREVTAEAAYTAIVLARR